jgi:uncharacterized protein
MKREIRVLGIDDCTFRKTDESVRVIGVVFRGGSFLDGVMSSVVRIDGDDATDALAAMVLKSKFLPQLQAIFLNGIAVGGFNVVDIHALSEKTGLPVIVVVRRVPDHARITEVLKRLKMPHKAAMIERAGLVMQHKRIHFQFAGTTEKDVRELLDTCTTHSFIPEPIRVAHLIGQGLILGESRGRA